MHDHRKLGRELGLFDTDPLIGAGLPYWLPDGAIVRHTLEEYIHGVERRSGCQHVYSPALGKRDLYEISGHWSYYREDMFPAMDLNGEQVVLRPSLCPHHALIYRSRARSYRELPLRIAELGGQYRAELSGVLGGLTRVRAIQLNDAHIFRTIDQVADEVQSALELIRQAHRHLGISPSRYRLSLPGEGAKYVGDPDMWQRAANLLTDALDSAVIAYDIAEGEAAFYGPKIDVQIADYADREATLSTLQVDFYQPERFDLQYVGRDGAKHRQPGPGHRAPHRSARRRVPRVAGCHPGDDPAGLRRGAAASRRAAAAVHRPRAARADRGTGAGQPRCPRPGRPAGALPGGHRRQGGRGRPGRGAAAGRSTTRLDAPPTSSWPAAARWSTTAASTSGPGHRADVTRHSDAHWSAVRSFGSARGDRPWSFSQWRRARSATSGGSRRAMVSKPPSTLGTGRKECAGTRACTVNSYHGHQLAVSMLVPPPWPADGRLPTARAARRCASVCRRGCAGGWRW